MFRHAREAGGVAPWAIAIGFEAFRWLSEAPGTGTIVGVYRYSLAWSDPLDHLLMLGNRGMGRLPQGILLDIPAAADWRALGVDVGQTVEASADEIRVAGGRMTVRLPADAVWCCRLPPPDGLAPQRVIVRNIEAARQGLAGAEPPDGLVFLLPHLDALARGRCPDPTTLPALCRAACQPLADLALAVRADDGRRLVAAAERLFGLGIGLTPSGDDVLVGVLATLVVLGGRLRPAATEVALRARGRTTRVAESFLEMAGRGAVAEVVGNFISAVVAGGGEDVGEAVQRLKRFGSTSGRETGMGVLLALLGSLEETKERHDEKD